ncbi:hypothetical protein GOC16_08390 [Sinorhizobium meliloti]|nr:hypothetical protein [Sinorhizobium meliloti]
MKDWREIQRNTARREHRELIAEAVTSERFAEMAKSKRIPAGSIWCWATSEVYGPIGSKEIENASAA